MKTYADFANDPDIGFGFDSQNDNDPTLRRVSDGLGSEIYFHCDDSNLAKIDAECRADDPCCEDPIDQDDDQGLIDFWAYVQKVIKRHALITYESSDEAEQILEKD